MTRGLKRAGIRATTLVAANWLAVAVAATCGWAEQPSAAEVAGNGPRVTFRQHPINGQSEYGSCAAIDVNRDGKLDIVSGGWWYEAPDWRPHAVREVEMIRGRYDDYSNLPLDVDGDGRLDLVSANYRSRSLYWVRQPAVAGQAWTRHMVAEPGPMETARLVDVDGDGRLDVLPNGVDFAAWWEVQPSDQGSSEPPRWTRHELPGELAAHGIGFGDIDGDGRGDVVGPRGWAQAPADRRRDRWIWQAEFQLHRDAGIAILVHDVDGDGDSDLVWGRGHRIGLYWLEQTKDDQGQRQWRQHTIDSSWSQAHCLMLEDIDNDGRAEVIAGKRYLGHDGRDIGEYDALGIYFYDFQPETGSWHRQVISEGGRAAVGLDPKVVDLDADGDLDLLVADRNGLFWLENLLVHPSSTPDVDKPATPPTNSPALSPAAPTELDSPRQPRVENHRELMVYPLEREGKVQLEPVREPGDWARRRADILVGMAAAMGPMPDSTRRVPLRVKLLNEERTERYVRQRIEFSAEPGDRVPALLLIPHAVKPASGGPTRLPAMLCLHQTTGIGKQEPAGMGGLRALHYAHELAERGYVCLVPDYPSFGEYPFDFRTQGARTQGAAYVSGSMKAIWNNLRSVDLLESLPQVDPDRIGVIGHSLGGHNALFTAAWDQRLQAVVTSCGFTAFHHYYGGRLQGWTSDRYMPRIRDIYGNDPDRVPFDFYEVLAAIAPRAIFVNAPLNDGNFDVAGVRKVQAAIGPVFELFQAEGKLQFEYPDSEHDFPERQRTLAYEWLDKQFGR